MSSFASSAKAATLLELAARQGTIQVGDKLFSNFTYSGTGQMPSDVNVIGITDTAGNYGIRFQGGFSDAVGGGASDALITYTVTVLDPNFVITDAHMASNIAVIGAVDPLANGTITETFVAVVPPTPSLNAVFVTNFNFNNILVQPSADYVWGIPGYTVINVSKDIKLDAGTQGIGSVDLSFVDQTFSQTAVPVPAAAWTGISMLAGLGAIGAFRKRRA